MAARPDPALRPALIDLLRQRSFRTGDFTLASGRRSDFYVDARPTTMSATGLFLIGTLGLAEIRDAGWSLGAVGGLTLGADPVAYAIARASCDAPPIVDAFSVRKQLKSHGTQRRIEGNFSPTVPVVVVEDVITTGGSALAAVEAVVADGGQVTGVLAVVDREEGGRERIEAAGISVRSLVTAAALRQADREQGDGA